MSNKQDKIDLLFLEETLKTVSELFFITTNILSEIIDAKDKYTEGHSERVRLYSVEIGKALGLSEYQLASLSLAAKLHDIGKVKIDDRILKKKSKLTKEERIEMERHPIYSEDLLGRHPVIEPVIEAIRSHHEYLSGEGYPDKLKGEAIPKLARIIAVADVFDALTSKRIYRKNDFSDYEALEYLKRYKNKWFDPDVVDTLVKLYEDGSIDYSRGSYYFRKYPLESLNLLKKALKKYQKGDIDKLYLMLGIIENKLWHPDKAIEILKKGLSIKGKYYYRIMTEIAFSKYYMGNLNALYENYIFFKEHKKNIPFIDIIRGYFSGLVFFWKVRQLEKALKLVHELDKLFYRTEVEKELLRSDTLLLLIEKKRENFDDIISLQAKGYNIMGEIMYDMGNYEQALRFYNNSISIKSVKGDLVGRAISLYGSAKTCLRMGLIEEAEARALNCYRTNLEQDDQYGLYLTSLLLSEIYLEKNDFENSNYYLKKANKLKNVSKTKDDYNRYHISFWLYELSTKKAPDLTEEIQKKIYQEKNWGKLLKAEMYYCLGWAYEHKDINLAIKYYKEAIDLYNEIKVVPEMEKVNKRLYKLELISTKPLQEA